MAKLRQRDDFKDGEIIQLRKNIDVCYASWFSITCREGITNYIHMLGADHMAYYLDNYRNVYRFSNHACERLNKRVRRMYLQKRRGGRHGKHISEAYLEFDKYPHTISIARWLQRVMMRNSGMGEANFSPNM